MATALRWASRTAAAARASRRSSKLLIAAGLKAPVRPRIRDEIWVKLWGNLGLQPDLGADRRDARPAHRRGPICAALVPRHDAGGAGRRRGAGRPVRASTWTSASTAPPKSACTRPRCCRISNAAGRWRSTRCSARWSSWARWSASRCRCAMRSWPWCASGPAAQVVLNPRVSTVCILLPVRHRFVCRPVALLDIADATLGFLDRIAEGCGAVRVQVILRGGQLKQAARRMVRVLHSNSASGFPAHDEVKVVVPGRRHVLQRHCLVQGRISRGGPGSVGRQRRRRARGGLVNVRLEMVGPKVCGVTLQLERTIQHVLEAERTTAMPACLWSAGVLVLGPGADARGVCHGLTVQPPLNQRLTAHALRPKFPRKARRSGRCRASRHGGSLPGGTAASREMIRTRRRQMGTWRAGLAELVP